MSIPKLKLFYLYPRLDIIKAIREGDKSIFESAFNSYFPDVYRYVFGKTKSAHIAEEVTQLTFIKLWQNRERLEDSVKLNFVIFRIASTTLIDEVRKQNNFRRLVNELGVHQSNQNKQEKPDALENNDMIKILLNKMPEMRRKVYEMSRLEGFTYEEIAVLLDISIKTVEKHVSKAIKQVKELKEKIYYFIIMFF